MRLISRQSMRFSWRPVDEAPASHVRIAAWLGIIVSLLNIIQIALEIGRDLLGR